MPKFRLNAGQHVGPDTTQKEIRPGKFPSKTYSVGDIVDSETDLVKKFGWEKFTLVSGGNAESPAKSRARQMTDATPEGTATVPVDTLPGTPPGSEGNGDEGDGTRLVDKYPDLENMTVAELKQVASDEEIDLEGAHTKQQIVKLLKKS